MKVILVDDEEWCLEELAEMLAEIDNVELIGTYNNATNALEAAARDTSDLIFIDVQMPGMSGLELAQRLKVLLKDVCFDIGVDDYILKPIRKERVLVTLGRVR